MDNQIVNTLIARIIVSTKTKKRQFSIYDTAEDIKSLRNETGSMQEVSRLIGISPGMLNQFLSVYKLPYEVIELVKTRQIDKVSIVHQLSKFKEKDAVELAHLIITQGISSQDLKIFVPYRKQFPNETIKELVKKVRDSKNIKVSVIRFSKRDFNKSEVSIKQEVTHIVGEDNFLALDSDDNYFDIKVTALGEKKLRETAKKQKKSFQEFISQIIK